MDHCNANIDSQHNFLRSQTDFFLSLLEHSLTEDFVYLDNPHNNNHSLQLADGCEKGNLRLRI